MSRLTKRVRSDVSPMILKLLNLEKVPDECVEVIGTDSKTCDEVCEENQCSSCVLSAVFEKLARYEDLEEQGKLIEQKHGRWKIIGMRPVGTHLTHYCSICGGHGDNEMDYCPNCGAKMSYYKDETKAKLAELKGTEE